MKYSRFVLLCLFLTLGCAVLPANTGLSVERVLDKTRGREAALDQPALEEIPTSPGESPENVGSPIRTVSNIPARRNSEPARLQWPLRNMKLSSAFGRRWGTRHQGIDLNASWGTPFYAAADGVVVYASDEISGYGDTLILRHRGNISTLYAHASSIIVEEGQIVTRGQAIGYVGDTGNATGPHLHFEVRQGNRPVDPWSFVSIPRSLSSKKRAN